MKVKELIERLKLENGDNEVVMSSTDGFDLIEIIKVANLNEANITVIVTKAE